MEPLWDVVTKMKPDARESFQAACALATYTPEDERRRRINGPVADYLLTLETSEPVAWRTALQPASKQLLEPLAAIFRSTAAREQARSYAAETLTDYAADDPNTLFDLLADAEQFQFPKVYSKLGGYRERIVELGKAELATQPAADASEEAKEKLARRHAIVAVCLLRLGAAEHVWPLLKHSPDPRVRSYLIHWLSSLGTDPQTIMRRFDEEQVMTIRRALLLALGEFTETQLPLPKRASLIDKLLVLYENDPDSGLHAAAEWLLRQWGQAEQVKAMVQKVRTDDPQRDSRQTADKRQWYVNSQGQTFVVLEAGTFTIGATLTISPAVCCGGRRASILRRSSAPPVTSTTGRVTAAAVVGFVRPELTTEQLYPFTSLCRHSP